jgi:hypothetical protein
MSSDPQGIDYSAVLADLEAKQAAIANAITVIRTLVSLNVQAIQIPSVATNMFPVQSPQADTELREDSFFNMTIVEAARKYLALRKRPATTPDVIDALRRGGQQNSSAASFHITVGSVLNRAYSQGAGIVRVARGTWGLAEWYPNKPRKPSSSNDD